MTATVTSLPAELVDRARAAAQRNLHAPPSPPALERTTHPDDPDADLTTLVDYRMRQATQNGNPPRHVDAWLAEARRRELANEHASPGWIHRTLTTLRRTGQL